MQKLILVCLALLSLSGAASAQTYKLEPIPQDILGGISGARKLDSSIQFLAAQAQGEGKDFTDVRLQGFMKLAGSHDRNSAQELLGKGITVRVTIPAGDSTLITFAGSLRAVIDVTSLEEVLSIQKGQRIYPQQPAFSGHN